MRGGVRGGRVGAVRAESTEELAGIRERFRSVGRRVRVVRAATRAEKSRAARRASGAATHATRCAAFETGFLAWRDVARARARARRARRSLRDDAGGAVARTGVSAGFGGGSTPSASTRGAETESGGVGGGDGSDAEGSSFGGDAGASAGAGAVDAAAAASVESLPFFRSLLATARRPRRSSPGRRDASSRCACTPCTSTARPRRRSRRTCCRAGGEKRRHRDGASRHARARARGVATTPAPSVGASSEQPRRSARLTNQG